jgi:hypothetical protein
MMIPPAQQPKLLAAKESISGDTELNVKLEDLENDG